MRIAQNFIFFTLLIISAQSLSIKSRVQIAKLPRHSALGEAVEDKAEQQLGEMEKNRDFVVNQEVKNKIDESNKDKENFNDSQILKDFDDQQSAKEKRTLDLVSKLKTKLKDQTEDAEFFDNLVAQQKAFEKLKNKELNVIKEQIEQHQIKESNLIKMLRKNQTKRHIQTARADATQAEDEIKQNLRHSQAKLDGFILAKRKQAREKIETEEAKRDLENKKLDEVLEADKNNIKAKGEEETRKVAEKLEQNNITHDRMVNNVINAAKKEEHKIELDAKLKDAKDLSVATRLANQKIKQDLKNKITSDLKNDEAVDKQLDDTLKEINANHDDETDREVEMAEKNHEEDKREMEAVLDS